MILKAEKIADLLDSPEKPDDPLVIAPRPDTDKLRQSGSASVDLRLGCWFMVLRQSRIPALDVFEKDEKLPSESELTEYRYVPFGEKIILHPRNFILGGTLEWIRLSSNLAAYVIGRSSWGRHGLVIATATAVHPGFTGCLTLELSNLGETPMTLSPGVEICQLFLHQVYPESKYVDKSKFIGSRRPTLGTIQLDETSLKLAHSRGT